jgi:parvulin-like peptidyl-prolyl isomerase
MDEFERMVKDQGVNLDAVKKRLRDSLRVQKVIRRKVALRVSVTDQEIVQYLEENRAKLETGLSYHARHILLVPEEGTADDAAWEAARIRAEVLFTQLTEAGADFAEMARQHSKDASARDGGDLGALKRGELSQEIESAILALAPGAVSRPFRSPLGYHIFKLESKDSLEGDGLVRVKQQIRDILFREKYETRLDAWLKEIKQRAIIEVRM